MGGERTTDIEFECPECGAAIRVRITRENPQVVRCECGERYEVTIGGRDAVGAYQDQLELLRRLGKEPASE